MHAYSPCVGRGEKIEIYGPGKSNWEERYSEVRNREARETWRGDTRKGNVRRYGENRYMGIGEEQERCGKWRFTYYMEVWSAQVYMGSEGLTLLGRYREELSSTSSLRRYREV
jgi:hypothetical protein